MSDAQSDNEGGTRAAERRIQISRLYLKDVSFESPAAPSIFSDDVDLRPQVNLQLNTETRRVGEDLYDVVLVVTVTGVDDERTVFLVEVKQAGLFVLAGYSEQETEQLVGTYCPTVLFPYAREVITDLVAKGGLPQLVLQPINFDALYARQQQEQGAAASDGGD